MDQDDWQTKRPTIAELIEAIGNLSVWDFCELLDKIMHDPKFLNIPVEPVCIGGYEG